MQAWLNRSDPIQIGQQRELEPEHWSSMSWEHGGTLEQPVAEAGATTKSSAPVAAVVAANQQAKRSRLPGFRASLLTFVMVFLVTTAGMIFFDGSGISMLQNMFVSGAGDDGTPPSMQPAASDVQFGPPSADAASISATLPSGRDLIATIQNRLSVLGFDPGPVDGIAGPKTLQAIADYQRQAELEPTGEPSVALLMHMQAGTAN